MLDSPALAPVAGSAPRARLAPLAERIAPAEFGAFYERVAPRLRGYLRSQTGDPAAADDLLQEAFARVLGSRLEPQSDEHLVRYLYRTASNLVRDRRRAAPRAPLPLEEVRTRDGVPAPDGLRHDLGRALGSLPAKQRQLLWLAHVEELDHVAIAEIVGSRSASVRVMLFRARRRLARLLGRSDGTERRSS